MSFLNEVPEASNYTFCSLVKSGALSGCWRAYNKDTEQVFIIKTIQKDLFSSPESSRKFIHELGILRNAHHQFINQFINLIDQPEQIHLVMEDIDGISLRDYISLNGPLSVSSTTELIGRLYVIAQYMKPQLGIEYCSFNADNIYVDKKGHLISYVIQQFNGFLNPKETAFTIPFHPPEVLTSKGYLTNADSWSICAIAYFCLTGKILFFCSNLEDSQKAVLSDPLKLNEKLSEEAKAFISKGMIKNPLMRLQLKNFMTYKFLEDTPIDVTQSEPIGIHDSPSKLNLHQIQFGKKAFVKISYKSSIPMIRKAKNINHCETMFW